MINYPGNARGTLHSDWPFNQHNAGHMPAPYPDMVAHFTTLWMLSPFSVENGGTIIVPGSHRMETNPSAESCSHDENMPYPTEIQATGDAGSVLVMDSRMWHAAGANRTDETRVAMAIRFAPWWLNLNGLRPGLRRAGQTDAGDRPQGERGRGCKKRRLRWSAAAVQPLFEHWVEH